MFWPPNAYTYGDKTEGEKIYDWLARDKEHPLTKKVETGLSHGTLTVRPPGRLPDEQHRQ